MPSDSVKWAIWHPQIGHLSYKGDCVRFLKKRIIEVAAKVVV